MEKSIAKKHLRLKSQVFALCVGVFFFLLCGFMLVVEQNIKERTFEHLNTLSNAKLELIDTKLSQLISNQPQRKLMDYQIPLQELFDAQQRGDLRLTLIQSDGVVVADSQLSLDSVMALDNHASRDEVVSAKYNAVGLSKRYSNTIKSTLVYFARSVRFINGENGFLRVSIPEAKEMELIASLRVFALVLFFLLVGALSITRWLEKKSLEKIQSQHQVRLEEKARETSKVFIDLQSVTAMLGICQSIDEANKVVMDFVNRFFPNTRCEIEIGDKLGYDIHSDSCWAARKNDHHINDLDNPINSCSHISCDLSGTHHSYAKCFPIYAQGELFGRGSIYFEANQHQFITQQYAVPLEFLFNNLALTYVRLLLSDKMREKAYTDSLTNIWNRRYFFEQLEKRQHSEDQYALIVLDVDNFKSVNDDLGHDAGDLALKRIARSISESVKNDEDVVARLGGEEFGILINSQNRTQIQAIYDRILFILSAKPLDDGRVVSLSAGVAFSHEEREIDHLYKFADSALYQAKRTGRKRCCFYGEATVHNLELAHSS